MVCDILSHLEWPYTNKQIATYQSRGRMISTIIDDALPQVDWKKDKSLNEWLVELQPQPSTAAHANVFARWRKKMKLSASDPASKYHDSRPEQLIG